MNLVLLLFNLIPAFPLDGGRVLRSILWDWGRDLARATRITSAIGSGFGILLILLGGLLLATGAVVAGVWNVLIGMFLRHAARLSYRQVLLRRTFEGEPVSRFMREEPVAVPRSISIEDMVRDFVLRHRAKMFPVVDGERLVGCITTHQLRRLPREEWTRQSVGAVAETCAPGWTVSPDTDAGEALRRMSSQGVSRLVVAEGDRLVGMLALADLLKFFSLKRELDAQR
jgi:CBS domain-containing protein